MVSQYEGVRYRALGLRWPYSDGTLYARGAWAFELIKKGGFRDDQEMEPIIRCSDCCGLCVGVGIRAGL